MTFNPPGSVSPPSSSHTITPSTPMASTSSSSAPNTAAAAEALAADGPPAVLPSREADLVHHHAQGGSTSSAVSSAASDSLSKRKGVKVEELDTSERTLAGADDAGGKEGAPTRPGQGRPRSNSSLVQVTKVEATPDQFSDQSAGFNANADWVNYKGAWVIHVVLIILGKILLDVVPGIHQDTSWTIVNISYMSISYIMFHYVTGTPFESNSGAYDELTLWEQIDDGAQYTPAKKWLTSVPIMLFLISTHYTRYNPWLFSLNFFVTLFVLFPKLPVLHRLRFRILARTSTYPSLPPTPTHSRPSTPAFARR